MGLLAFLSPLVDCSLRNCLTAVIFVLVFYAAWSMLNRPRNLPPGPYGVPIFGYLPFLNKEGGPGPIAINYGRKLKSDIIYLNFCFRKLVVINSYEKIKELFVKRDDFVDRPSANFFQKFLPNHEGLVFASGRVWKEHRRFSLSVLRDFGMGKIAAEDIITEELRHMIKAIEAKNEKSINPRDMITEAISNIICSLIFGQRYEYADKEFVEHVRSINRVSTDTAKAKSSLLLQPWMQYLPKCMDIYNFQAQKENFANVMRFVNARIAEHKARFNPDHDDDRDYIDVYLRRMREGKETFTDFQLGCEIFDLFFAGTETTSSTLHWGIHFMAKFPEVQARVKDEISTNIGRHRLPAMKDRLQLPYTEAILMEVQRMGTILPVGVLHTNATHDVEFDGYVIPKGTFVAGNVLAVHGDPNIWPDPENFNPCNFYSEDGKHKNQDKLIPFLIGRRSCIGESLAKMELFLFFTMWLQRFTIVSSDTSELDRPAIGSIRQPAPFHVRFQVDDN